MNIHFSKLKKNGGNQLERIHFKADRQFHHVNSQILFSKFVCLDLRKAF